MHPFVPGTTTQMGYANTNNSLTNLLHKAEALSVANKDKEKEKEEDNNGKKPGSSSSASTQWELSPPGTPSSTPPNSHPGTPLNSQKARLSRSTSQLPPLASSQPAPLLKLHRSQSNLGRTPLPPINRQDSNAQL
jgi:hypothetical protein